MLPTIPHLAPPHPLAQQARLNLASAFAQCGDHAAALSAATEGVRLAPANPTVCACLPRLRSPIRSIPLRSPIRSPPLRSPIRSSPLRSISRARLAPPSPSSRNPLPAAALSAVTEGMWLAPANPTVPIVRRRFALPPPPKRVSSSCVSPLCIPTVHHHAGGLSAATARVQLSRKPDGMRLVYYYTTGLCTKILLYHYTNYSSTMQYYVTVARASQPDAARVSSPSMKPESQKQALACPRGSSVAF